MRVAALQFDVRIADVEANRVSVRAGCARAAREGVELLVLPEMWPTSFLKEVDTDALNASEQAEAELMELSRDFRLIVCGSSYGKTESGKPANRLALYDHGTKILSYDKVHLFSPTAEDEVFAAGIEPPATVRTSSGLVSGAVCYDLRFPELLRVPFRAGAEIICVPAQWPEPRSAHWRALVIGRAIEGQCFVVACNRTGTAIIGRRGAELVFPGNSLIVSPHGEVLAEGKGEAGLVACDVDLDVARRMRVRVPVEKDERRDLYVRWTRPSATDC